ncbi:hypothetical protein P8797_02655 [Bacillus subtilis]|nr:hypothetical protein [Bacillus subtilis]MCY9145669.1 hypothetical protein [Bacillus sp. T9C1]MEC0312046.1 hypothetical protein [Bacillus subtilis]MEC0363646.1 hypothetical protein [Bacillus subtilis]
MLKLLKYLKIFLIIAAVIGVLYLLRGLIVQLLGIGLLLFVAIVGLYFVFRMFAGLISLLLVVAGGFVMFGLIFKVVSLLA